MVSGSGSSSGAGSVKSGSSSVKNGTSGSSYTYGNPSSSDKGSVNGNKSGSSSSQPSVPSVIVSFVTGVANTTISAVSDSAAAASGLVSNTTGMTPSEIRTAVVNRAYKVVEPHLRAQQAGQEAERRRIGEIVGSMTGAGIERAEYNGDDVVLKGWTCRKTRKRQLHVQIYAGGPADKGQLVGIGYASEKSSDKIDDRCETKGIGRRFTVRIPRKKFDLEDRSFYAYGMYTSKSGTYSVELGGSGKISLPSLKLTGEVKALRERDGHVEVLGWACAKGYAGPVRVRVFAGDPDKGGKLIGNDIVADGKYKGFNIREKCRASGDHEFLAKIPFANLEGQGGKKIYVRAISPGFSPHPNKILRDSGEIEIPKETRRVLGVINSVKPVAVGLIIKGWACAQGYNGAIDVRVFAGNPNASGKALGPTIKANEEHPGDIGVKCRTNSSKHAFEVVIPQKRLNNYAGKKIFVRGLAVDGSGQPNINLQGSGEQKIPH